MNPDTFDRPVLGMTKMMPTIARPYRSAPITPDPRIIRGTSRWGLCISSDAPLDNSKPTHRKTSTPITVRNPFTDGLRSACPYTPAGRPCRARNTMNRIVKIPTTAILTKVPMFGAHFP